MFLFCRESGPVLINRKFVDFEYQQFISHNYVQVQKSRPSAVSRIDD